MSLGDITSIIKKEIEGYEEKLKLENVGHVMQVGDGVARIYGLDDCMSSELLEFPGNVYGIAMNLEEDNVGAILLGSDANIKEGDIVKTTGKIVQAPAGKALLGRVVNALGQPIDGKGPIATDDFRSIEGSSPNVVERQPVKEPLQTGIKSIDAMIPIGRGKRELIIGDRQTAKTAVALDTIINQKGTGVLCVYVAIGQKQSTVAQVVEKLRQFGAMDYTIVISATASHSASFNFVAPYAGRTMGE